jgi:hypothetical protein
MRAAWIAVASVFAAAAVTIAAAPSVTGTWTMTVEGSPHGNMTTGLVLKQDGTKVTGTFSTGHSPDMTVSGEFANGELKLETPADGDSKIVFTAKLKDDGTLAGHLSSPMGDMKWTASRAPGEKKQ